MELEYRKHEFHVFLKKKKKIHFKCYPRVSRVWETRFWVGTRVLQT